MNKRLSPSFIELANDALLKAFWHKPALRLFLQQHGVKESVLAQWHSEQSKREYVGWLWPQLVKTDRGHEAILDMARSLAEMRHFPDLERKEDTRVLIPGAKAAIARLKDEVAKVNAIIEESAEAAERRRVAREEMAKRLAAQRSLVNLQEQLTGLTPKLGTPEGGYEFERWFYDLAIYFELDARPGYKADGRQIDGALTIEGTTFLLETKFTQEPVGSSDVDIFMAKIESKADNTMGLFVSISGFNGGAIKAASKPKTPMLLLDHAHIFSLILRGVMRLPQVVSRIKRHASQTGRAHLSASDF
jgi:Restriction endonuclease